MKIEIVGDFFGSSGYSNHVKGLTRALAKKYQVMLSGARPQGWENSVSKEDYAFLQNNFRADVTIAIAMPFHWKQILGNNPKNFIGFLVWECDTIPDWFLDYCNDPRVKAIFVPSEFCKDAALRSGVTTPVFVVSHGYDPEVFKPLPEQPRTSEKFTILYPKGWAKGRDDRCGFDILLEAFVEEFKKEEPVRLIAKFNKAYLPQGWDPKIEFQKLGVNLKDAPEFLVTMDDMSREQLNMLYNDCDVVCVPTKGEAFGMPMLEAMGCGKPVITSDYGGQTDFAYPELLPTTKGPATDGILYEDGQWGYINKETLKETLRDFFNHCNDTDFEEECITKAKKFTWARSAEQVEQALKELNL